MLERPEPTTPFADLVDGFGWRSPAEFIRVYAAVAARIGERDDVTDRQVRWWWAPSPPCPQPGRQRVLEILTEAVDHVTFGWDGRWSGRGETLVAAVDRVG